MNTWTHENPHTHSHLLCINLLAQSPDSVASSCPGGISVEIDVVIDIAYTPVENSSVEVSQTQALLETEVIQGLTDQQGQLRLSLQQPGSYLVQVVLYLISIYHGSSPNRETGKYPPRWKRMGSLASRGSWRLTVLPPPAQPALKNS